ncbi:MAG: ROK family protein [Candidatus Dormibacteraeota bacterium]|nr:ROK family protein [Candidatus Dormibacteraeota bacterium]MBO0745464.1 ROK family protein [Candidatus Dormibacteraeota bacterium]
MPTTVSSRTKVLAGIDLGGTQVRVVFGNAQGEILSSARTQTKALGTPRRVVAWIGTQARRHEVQLKMAAIGAPGPVEPRTGMLINPPNLGDPRHWYNVPITELLRMELGCPVQLQNDANLAGLGEYHHGAARGSRDMVYITWSTGVGGGVVADGHLLDGAHGSGGEVGHMIIDPNGPVCGCGQRGCVEAICSGANIQKRYGIPAKELLEAAAEGDQHGTRVAEEMATAMGIALINVSNVYDPEVIVIGGGITQSWRVLQPRMMKVLRASPFVTPRRRPRVRKATLGTRVGEVGAIEWARTWYERGLGD